MSTTILFTYYHLVIPFCIPFDMPWFIQMALYNLGIFGHFREETQSHKCETLGLATGALGYTYELDVGHEHPSDTSKNKSSIRSSWDIREFISLNIIIYRSQSWRFIFIIYHHMKLKYKTDEIIILTNKMSYLILKGLSKAWGYFKLKCFLPLSFIF